MAFLLLLNLLIAMMGDTYNMIAEIKNEWIRQVGLKTNTAIKPLLSFIEVLSQLQW